MNRIVLLVAALAASALTQQRPVPQVPGAVASLESRDVPAIVVRFTNLSEVGLRSLDLEVKTPAGALTKSWSGNPEPLGTGGSGEVVVATPARAADVAVRVRLAMFADGGIEGDPDEVTRVRTLMTALVEDLSTWRDALSVMPRTPSSEAIGFLRATTEQRRVEKPNDPSGMRRLVEVWLREDRAQGFAAAVVENELKNIDMRLKGIGPAPPATRLPSRPVTEWIRLASAPGSAREFTVKVQNLRNVPLEAWAAAVSESQSGRPLRMIGRDTVRDLDQSASPAIAPGATVGIGTYLPEADVVGGLKVHLEFAMWQDLQWQGFELNEQRTLANRELSAEEYAFFIGPLRTAAGLPVHEALELLQTRQQEFRAGPLGRQSSGLQQQLAEWERLARSAPLLLAGQLTAHANLLEQRRTVLLRHRQK